MPATPPDDARRTETFSKKLIKNARSILEKGCVAALIYYSWTSVQAYHETAFCFHALSFITVWYLKRRDKKESILVLGALLFTIMTTFYLKHLFASVFLMTILSVFLLPFYHFQTNILGKITTDFVIAAVKYLTFSDSFALSSRLTDFISLGVYLHLIWFKTYPNINGKYNDILLIVIGLAHAFAFGLELFTHAYFIFVLFVTLLWIYVSS